MFKFVKNVRSHLLGSAATGFIAVLAMGGTAAAVTSGDFTYSTTKTAYYSIHPMDLAPDNNTTVTNYDNDFSAASLFGTGCFSVGVHLPQGSRITQLLVWYTSPPIGADPIVLLFANSLASGTTITLVNSTIVDDSSTRKLATLPIAGGSSPVSNTGFSYGFGVCLGGAGNQFHGARITYTYTNAGD